ncbi:uncharacterized protein LOC133038081 [Cannabis sativa]|uniref:uncharacterized protein LOC133038081 n=1 Tax=Cannabis sativa TaxID=3483 RepID=UPI0029CA8BB7|nr:uncharacterized protein LOC133038081 [Cannabis sativa]
MFQQSLGRRRNVIASVEDEGCWIAECSILAQEVLNSFKNKKGKQGVMAIKTDMSKAYDRIEWSFLLRVLKANGFSDKACNLIMKCVTSMSYSILLNGAPLAPFNPKRGLRQGDPLSPFLFILCSEVLTKLIVKAESRGELSGVKVSRNAMPISHLFYVDEAIFFCKANVQNAKAFADCITTCEKWSGQVVNKRKSGLVFSPNTQSRYKEEVKQLLGMNFLSQEEKYLGNPFFFSASKRKDFISSKIKFWPDWKVGRLSVSLKREERHSWEQCCRVYLLISWPRLRCLLRCARTLIEWWPNSGGWETQIRLDIDRLRAGKISVSLKTVEDWVLDGFGIEQIKESFHYTRRHRFCNVSDLFVGDSRTWNEDIIKSSFSNEVATAILQIQPLQTSSDILFWKASKSREFCVKSAYGLSQQPRFQDRNSVWSVLWKSSIHPRLKLFLWKIWSDILPTKVRLGMWENHCVFCGEVEESAFHLFCNCNITRALWFQSKWGFRMDMMNWTTVLIKEIRLRASEMLLSMEAVEEAENRTEIPMDSNMYVEFTKYQTDASVVCSKAGLGVVEIANEALQEWWVAVDFSEVSGVLEGELRAIHLALLQARSRKVTKLLVQSDSKVTVLALNFRSLPFAWGTSPVYESCRSLCKYFDQVIFSFVPRSANVLADYLAGWARNVSACNSGFLRDVAPFVATTFV